MSRLRQRADRIKTEISISQLLFDYGYPVQVTDYDLEQQFPCDLHGDGFDNKPSARIYPEGNRWYCFSCGKQRDPIETVRDKEGLGFVDAIARLEKRYHLPELPWQAKERTQIQDPTYIPGRGFEEESARVHRFLTTLTHEKALPLENTLKLWEAYDYVVFVGKDQNDHRFIDSVLKIRTRAMEMLKA